VDGKGESIWDRFSHTVGLVKGAETGDVACYSYRCYKEDVAIAKKLNLKSCRFSISWPRIQADGTGKPNPRGLDYYKRLTDELIAAKIRPLATLYHWDLPQALEDKGGWPNRDMAKYFADYCEIVVKELGHRVNDWCIFNEPWVFTMLGYSWGIHAPGRKDFDAFLRASHVVNLAQGAAFRTIKGVNPKLKVGTAYSVSYCQPATDSEADKKAAARADALGNVWFLQPAMKGTYPEAFVGGNPLEKMGVKAGDMELVKAPLDFFGMNYYQRAIIAAAEPNKNRPGVDLTDSGGTDGPKTDMGWEIWPDGFYELLMRISREYKSTPVEITENGASYLDGRTRTGRFPTREEWNTSRVFERVRASDEGWSEHSRVPLLEFAGQFRMGGRVHTAIWARVWISATREGSSRNRESGMGGWRRPGI